MAEQNKGPAHRKPQAGPVRPAFSLIELLVVISLIALVLAIMLPSLADARRRGVSVKCSANLRSLITAMHAYSAGASDEIVPSYNMKGIATGVANPLDGWGPILDRMGILTGSREFNGNPFCCPATVNVAGMSTWQTGTDPDRPKGYMDWPAVVTTTINFATTIPSMGFDKIIRVGYWINADNTIGTPQVFQPGVHFSGSVGYGPDPHGKFMGFCYMTRIKKPSELIALSDGVYAGKQESTRQGDVDSRIGYRHPRGIGVANTAFADGHVGSVRGDRFPRKNYHGLDYSEIWNENTGDNPTVYADPARDLRPDFP